MCTALPGRPQNVSARELSAGSCEVLVEWIPPNNTDSAGSRIDHYVIYTPSLDRMDTSDIARFVINIPNCRNSIIVIRIAAVNSIGCEGLSSDGISPTLLPLPPTPDTQTPGKY